MSDDDSIDSLLKEKEKVLKENIDYTMEKVKRFGARTDEVKEQVHASLELIEGKYGKAAGNEYINKLTEEVFRYEDSLR